MLHPYHDTLKLGYNTTRLLQIKCDIHGAKGSETLADDALRNYLIPELVITGSKSNWV